MLDTLFPKELAHVTRHGSYYDRRWNVLLVPLHNFNARATEHECWKLVQACTTATLIQGTPLSNFIKEVTQLLNPRMKIPMLLTYAEALACGDLMTCGRPDPYKIMHWVNLMVVRTSQ